MDSEFKMWLTGWVCITVIVVTITLSITYVNLVYCEKGYPVVVETQDSRVIRPVK